MSSYSSENTALKKVPVLSGYWLASVFLLSFALFARTTTSVFLFDDNSEFLASSHLLGITHAPGYPIFSLLGKLFSYLIPGQAPLAINLTSAFFAALACMLAFMLVFRITKSVPPALIAASMLATSRIFWGQASQAEVYALNLFFFLLTINLLWNLRGDRKDAVRLFSLAAIIMIGIVNHYTIAYAAPFFLAFAMWIHRRNLGTVVKWVLPAVFIALTIVSFYHYLPTRSAARPKIQWKDQSTVSGFAKHVQGIDRRVEAPRIKMYERIRYMKDYLRRIARQWTPLLLFLIPFGIAAMFMHKARGVFLLILYLAFFPGLLFLLNYMYCPRGTYVISVFHIPSIALLCIFAACGADLFFKAIRKMNLPWLPVWAIIIVLIGYSGIMNLEFTDNANNHLAERYGKNILRNVARDGIVFSRLETESFPVAAYRAVFGIRRDVLLFGNQGDSAADVFHEEFSADNTEPEDITDVEMFVLQKALHRRPIYFTFRRKLIGMPDVALHSNGLLYEVNPSLELLAQHDPWDRIDMTGIDISYPHYDYITRNVIGKYHILHAERLLEIGLGEEALAEFQKVLAFNPESRSVHADVAGIYMNVGEYERAMHEYEAALAVDPENVELDMGTLLIYNNLSYIYGVLGKKDKAREMMETAISLDPNDPLLLVNMGQTYYELEDYEKAIDPLEEAIKRDVDSAFIYNILAVCYEKTGDNDKALSYYMKSVQMGPNYARAFHDYGVFATYVLGDMELAVDLLSRYLELAPQAPDAIEVNFNVGFMLQRLGKHEKAINNFRAARVLGAGSNHRRLAIIQSSIAASYEALNKPDMAMDAYEQGLYGAQVYPEIYRDFGRFLYRTGIDYQRAYLLLENYLAASPSAEDRLSVETNMTLIKAELQEAVPDDLDFSDEKEFK